MKLNYGFLSKPVEYWPKVAGYLEAKLIINKLSVVNDAAKRVSNLLMTILVAQKRETTTKIFCTVENDRRLLPNQRKRKLISTG